MHFKRSAFKEGSAFYERELFRERFTSRNPQMVKKSISRKSWIDHEISKDYLAVLEEWTISSLIQLIDFRDRLGSTG